MSHYNFNRENDVGSEYIRGSTISVAVFQCAKNVCETFYLNKRKHNSENSTVLSIIGKESDYLIY
jgi:hypothetical protein